MAFVCRPHGCASTYSTRQDDDWLFWPLGGTTHATKKNMGASHILACALHVPTTFLSLFNLIYEIIEAVITLHDNDKKKHNKTSKKPLNLSYRFFASKDTLVITMCSKNKKYPCSNN
jgi:hypothetical protein